MPVCKHPTGDPKLFGSQTLQSEMLVETVSRGYIEAKERASIKDDERQGGGSHPETGCRAECS